MSESDKKIRSPRRRRGAAVDNVAHGDHKEHKLYSGSIAEFNLIKLSYEDLVKDSFVDEAVNGREQDNITPDNVSGVSDTIADTQFYPCYVVKNDEGKYEFIDGSRRRAGAIEKKIGLECYVSEDEFTIADKIHLAQQLQTAKEHNFREQGLKIKHFIESEGIEQQEAAKIFNHSPATISRLLKAASISKELLAIFPDRDLISLDNFGKLASVEKELSKQQLPVPVFLDDNQGVIEQAISQELPGTEKAKHIVDVLVAEAFNKPVVKKEPVEEFPLAHYTDKNKYAKILSQGDKVQFVFKGIKPSLTKEIENFIKSKIQ
ncbi:MAG: ParB/RepB/Spo0J family partition protein [Thalassotalea sp.]|nr:ParB/RepB/Spo0J family partition protein [Thalassotalea sp.]